MLTKCIWCNEEAIEIMKSMLGGRCYSSLVRHGVPSLPLKRRASNIELITKKYGAEIISDFEKVRINPYWKLSDVAKKHGFSRERSRQIFTEIYGYSYGIAWQSKIKLKGEYVCRFNPFHKLATHSDKRKAIVEISFIKECEKRGYKIEILSNPVVNFRINNYSISVRTENRGKFIHSSFSYLVLKKHFKEADFIACYHPINRSFFIIPISAIIETKRYRKPIYIRKKPGDIKDTRTKNRYYEFKNAFHLLK